MTLSADISDSLRSAEDIAYSQAPFLGLHAYSCYLVTVITTGVARPGIPGATRIKTSLRLTVGPNGGYAAYGPGDGYLNPGFQRVSGETIVLQGGQFSDRVYLLGPLVRPYTANGGGGTDTGLFQPPDLGNTQVWLQVFGPGLDQVNGSFFQVKEFLTESSLSYRVRIEATGQVPPPGTAALFTMYAGVGLPGQSSPAFIQALGTRKLSATNLLTFSVNAGPPQAIYYAYPSVFGSVNFLVNGFLGGFNLVSNSITSAAPPTPYTNRSNSISSL